MRRRQWLPRGSPRPEPARQARGRRPCRQVRSWREVCRGRVGRYSGRVPDPKHPAAKAGRLVRAVGLGIARELDKLADAPPKARPAPPPPPPPVRTGGVIGTAVFYAFIVGLVAGVLSVLKADELAHGTPRLVFR